MENTEKTTVRQRLAPAVKKAISLLLSIVMVMSIFVSIPLTGYGYEISDSLDDYTNYITNVSNYELADIIEAGGQENYMKKFFEQEIVSEDWGYRILDDGTAEVLKYYGTAKNVNVPSEIDGYIVTSIRFAFLSSDVVNVTLPETLIEIGEYAFGSCYNLKSVNIPASVLKIGRYAFSEVTLDSNVFEVPDGVQNIGFSALPECGGAEGKITNEAIILPSSLKNISKIPSMSVLYGLTTLVVEKGSYPEQFATENSYRYSYNLNDVFFCSEEITKISKCMPEEIKLDLEKNQYSEAEIFIENQIDRIADEQGFSLTNWSSYVNYVFNNLQTNFSKENEVRLGYKVNFPINSSKACVYVFPIMYTYIENKCLLEIYEEVGKTFEINLTYRECTHNFDGGKIIEKETCLSNGVKTYTCTKCGATKTETIKATGHKAVTDKAVAATCTKAGKTAGSHCSVCGAVITAQKTVSATGHSYNRGKVTKATTCTANGVKTYTCTKCKAAKTETIKATGHKAVTDKAVSATCIKAGKTAGSHCSVCGAVIKAQKTVSATGHSYDKGKVTKSPTVTATGVKTYTCTKCGAKKTEKIKATGLKKPTLKVTVNANGSFKLSWGKVTGAEKYELYVKQSDGSYKLMKTTTGTSFTTGTAVYGKQYTYKMRAVKGKTKSAYSSAVNAKNTKKLQTPKLKATVNKNGSFKLSWGKVTGATSYQIYMKQANGKYKLIKKTTATSFKTGVAKKGKTYTYKVRAVTSKNSKAASNYSNVVNAKRK